MYRKQESFRSLKPAQAGPKKDLPVGKKARERAFHPPFVEISETAS
jgi:hypothetical protein